MHSRLFICVMVFLFIDGYRGDILGKFPLENCSGDLDILGLLDNDKLLMQEQFAVVTEFYSQVSSLNHSSVHAAVISHMRGTQIKIKEEVIFNPFINRTVRRKPFNFLIPFERNINTDMEVKIKLTESIFQEVSTVRTHANHVGIIFLDGSDMTHEEVRNVSSIVQHRKTDVKILVLIYGSNLVQEVVYLTDTIVLPRVSNTRQELILMMAVCKLCLQGWYTLEYNFGAHARSCYRLDKQEQSVWSKSMSMCNFNHGGFLARIETLQEMTFLQDLFREFILENIPPDNVNMEILVYIGLILDLNKYSWFSSSGKNYPLVIDYWKGTLKVKPETRKECGGWIFQYILDSGIPLVVDGWVDIMFVTKPSLLLLCEVALPRQVNNNNIIKMPPATQDSFQSALAKGDFATFRGNIVSVFENVANDEFLYILQTTKEAFPMFDCAQDTRQQRYIPYSLVCDGIEHCGNKRDEANCYYTNNVLDYLPFCASGVRCMDGTCSPLQVINGRTFECLIYSHTMRSYKTIETPPTENITDQMCVVCNAESCVEINEMTDGFVQCTKSVYSGTACGNRVIGFKWVPKCANIKAPFTGYLGCPDKSYLRDCKDYQCSEGYVKCFDSYCIPQHYLLDGEADCPTGEDEQTFYIGPCTGNFACWNSKVCLHPDRVCDGHYDCPNKDDEINCNTYCPQGLRCTAGTVVSNGSMSSYVNLDTLARIDPRTRYLDMTGIDLSDVEDLFRRARKRFVYLAVLILSNCNVSNIILPDNATTLDYFPRNIRILDVSYNRIPVIFRTDIFVQKLRNMHYLNASHNKQLVSIQYLQFDFLEILDLSYTGLSYLNDSVFEGLPSLKHLNLSNTLISDFSKKYFSPVFILETLDLRGVLIEDLTADLFHGLTISQSLYTDQFQVCCPKIRGFNIPYYFCLSPVATISSCDNLIGLSVQRVLLWLVAVLAVLGNVTIIVYRVIWDRSVLKVGYGLFVTNLGISDFMMGVYLFIIAGADYVYRDNYVFHDTNWREGVSCKFAGFIATLSHESSSLFSFLITLDRLLVIKYPFGQIHFSDISKIASVILVWLISCLLSLIPIVFNFNIYSSNAMCLGLPLTTTQVNGWEYSVGLFVIYNGSLFFMIACGQLAIFRAMSKNKIAGSETNMSRSLRARDITVVKQLSLVAISNFLCWFPVGIMGLLSLGGHEISDEVYSWTTVLLLPSNSAINPVLYTIPALMNKWTQFKKGA